MNRFSGRFLALLSWLFLVLVFISLWRGLFDDPQGYTAPLSAGAMRFAAGCFVISGALLVLPATQGTVRLFCLLLFLPLALVVPGGLSPLWGLAVFTSLGFLLGVLQVWGLTPDRYLAPDSFLRGYTRPLFRSRPGLQLLLGGLIGAMLVLGVIGINRLGREYLASWFSASLPLQRTGLSEFVDLGAIDELKQSDRVLLHVRGDSPELLRVRVFSKYQSGRWTSDEGAPAALAIQDEPISGPGVLTFRRVSGRDSWVALPSEAGRIWADSALESDRGGGVRGVKGRSPDRWSWRRDGESVSPVQEDLEGSLVVPPHLEGVLAEKSRIWRGKGDISLQGQLDALTEGLHRASLYALSFERSPHVDPVLDFLTAHPQGNCEAFASSFALLARSIGIPARVVTGFRVSERNPLSGHWLVRERDAHAWVEVRVDGRWLTRDPTPGGLGEASSRESDSQIAYLLDALHSQALRTWDRIFDMTLDEIALVILALGGILMGYQLKRNWNQSVVRLGLQAEASGPLPEFEQMEKRLRELGYIRLRGETLHEFSRRLEQVGGGVSGQGAWIRNYAAWRYGGEGTRGELERSFLEVRN